MANEQARVEVLTVDINGIARGKWERPEILQRVLDGKIRLPLSTLILDIWDRDTDAVFSLAEMDGDPDGLCITDRRTLKPLPWASGQQVLATLYNLDGTPNDMDPRAQLTAMAERFAEHGWTPVVACELEFYLLDGTTRDSLELTPPHSLRIADARRAQLYVMDAAQGMEEVLQTIRTYAEVQDIPVDSVLAEKGPGQFEVNLIHKADPLAAADDAFCLKRLITHAAAKYGLMATFMAKPYSNHVGSGMHMHVSVIDRDGNNVLDMARPDGLLYAAVAGLVNRMQEAQAVFAPHANSYRRFVPGNFVPLDCNWAPDHRGVAVRLPDVEGPGARLECRTPGADINPYLTLTAILGCMFEGMTRSETPPPAATDPKYDASKTPTLTHDWLTAIDRFAHSDTMAAIFGKRYRDIYAAVKRSEAMTLQVQVPDLDLQTYLGRI